MRGVVRAKNSNLSNRSSQYHHNRTGEDNADAHLKRQIMGREVVVAITNGKLDLGPWEQISTVNLMATGASGFS